MIKPILGTASVLALFAAPLAAQDVTKTGTVVDVSCYSALGIAGPSHRACADTCALAGVPMAIMIDGVICMPVSPKPKDVAGLVIKSIEVAS